MKITLSKQQWEFIGKKTKWLNKQAGEDWMVTEPVKNIVNPIINEIKKRGGSATKSGINCIDVQSLPVDLTHYIPLKIEIYEGTYDPDKALINATFSEQYPIPIKDRTPFDAKLIIDAVVEGFMSLANYSKEK